MKVFVLGLDGLEYDFIKQWNFTNLKQKQFGKIKVPINETLRIPYTPEVWGAFLTGKHCVSIEIDKSKRPLDVMFRFFRIAHKITHLSFGFGPKIKTKVPVKLHTRNALIFPKLRYPTFLDLTESEEINAPYYSFQPTEILEKFGANKLSLRTTITALKRMYMLRKKQFLSVTKDSANVVFAYMHFPDLFHHFYLDKLSRIKRLYNDLDYYVRNLKCKFGNGTLFIIVSDHGFNISTGTHSLHGFYSSNEALYPEPEEITDFFEIITQRAKRSLI